MVRGCSVLVLLFCHQVLSSSAPASPVAKNLPDADQEQQENENEVDSTIDYHHQNSWLTSLLGLSQRHQRSEKDNMFWATRGKRSDMDVEDMEDFWATRGKKQTIKPNGFFQAMPRSQPGKRNMKPNGLFSSLKRAGLKPNSLFSAYKRGGFKPNGLFGTFKRSLKPNGLFGSFKRAGLKPNGLFGTIKRSVLKPNGLFGAYKRAEEHVNFIDEDYNDEDMEIEMLAELLKEALENEENDEMDKREDFWAARGKKDANFWATRG